MADHFPLALLGLGVLLVAVGAGLIYIPAGLIVAGACAGTFGVLVERGRSAPSPGDEA